MIKERPPATLVPTDAYVHEGYLWVPHYQIENVFAGVTGQHLPDTYLKAMGAIKTVLMLWSRGNL